MHRLNSNVIIINRNYGSEQYCALLYVAIDVDVIVIVVVKIIVVDVAELVLYIMNILAGCHRIRPRPCTGAPFAVMWASYSKLKSLATFHTGRSSLIPTSTVPLQ